MELFAIHCTTCKARLVVKDESVIGDILGCPKCGSMVQIVPPPGWRRSDAAAPAESSNLAPPTATPKSPASMKSPAAGSPTAKPASSQAPKSHVASPKTEQSQTAPSASTIRKAAAVIPPALPPRQPAAHAAAELQTATVSPPVAVPEPVLGAATETMAPSLLANLVTRARQDWMLLAGGLAGGVVLGGVVWLAVWLSSPNPTAVAVQSSDAQSSTVVPAESNAPAQAAAAAPAVPVTEPPPAEATTQLPAESPSATATPESSPPPTADENLPATNTPPPVDDAVQTSTPTEPATEPAAPEATPAESPAPALKLEPVAPSASTSEPAAAESPAAGEDVTGTAAAAEPSAGAADVSNPDMSADAGDSHELNIREPAAAVKLNAAEIEKRLTVPLERVEFARVPLAQFAAFIGDVSGVPVVLDDAALVHVGKTRKTPIDVKLSGTTAAAALRAVSQHAGLSYSIEDGRILITAAKR